VNQIDKRVMEALRAGFTCCVIPVGNFKMIKHMKEIEGIEIKTVGNVQETLDILL